MQLGKGLGAQVLFLSPLAAVGGLMLFFSQIFGWVFLSFVDVPGIWEWRGPLERSAGRVVSVEGTSSRVNRRQVMKITFEDEGGAGRGVSFTTLPRGLTAGAPVELEHPLGKPGRMRIAGMESSVFPAWALLPILPVPLVGLILFGVAMLGGRRRLRTLRAGELGSGELTARTPTNTKINRQRVHRHVYRFTTIDGRSGETVARSHHNLPSRAEVVYHPETLDAVVVAALPGRASIDASGELVGSRPVLALFAAAAPLLGLAGWAAAIVVNLR